MLKVRKHPNVRTSVHISSLNLRLPADGQWVSLARYPSSELEESANLKEAFERNLIEVEVVDSDYTSAPTWYLAAYTDAVRVPKEILEYKEADTLTALANLKKDAHPLMAFVLQATLFPEEVAGQNRPGVIAAIVSLTDNLFTIRGD